MKSVPALHHIEPSYARRCLSLIEKTLLQLLEHPDLPDMFAYLDSVSSVSVGRCAREKSGPQTMELLFAIGYAKKPSYDQFRDRITNLLALMKHGDALSGCFTDPETRHLHFTFDDLLLNLPAGSLILPPQNSAIVVSEGTNYLLIELYFNNSYLRAVS